VKESDLKKSSSETIDISKADVWIPAAIEKDVNECSAYLRRMMVKLALQQHVAVDKWTSWL